MGLSCIGMVGRGAAIDGFVVLSDGFIEAAIERKGIS